MADDWGNSAGWEAAPGAGAAADNTDWEGNGDASGGVDQFGAGEDTYGQECQDGFGAGGEGGNDACFTCGETGHRKAECPNREARGPITCNQCGQEGHIKSECTAPRAVDRSHVADLTPEAAWAKIKQAIEDQDHDDAEDAIQEYVKALNGEPTYRDLQEGFTREKMNIWLIGLEANISGAFTIMDLQGNTGKTYSVTVQFSKTPPRKYLEDSWPPSEEDILTRLDDAGIKIDSGKLRCYNCGEYGHSSRSCPEPEREREQTKVTCNNCGGEHRIRDCTEVRVDKNACKNCGESGHRMSDCPEPPDPSKMTCRKCEETGHMARDCPQGGGGRACHNCGEEGHISKECPNPRVIKCRNCDEEGHTGRECPKPRDWSRVQCSNCQQFGHTKVRCKEPTKEEPDDGFGEANGDGFTTNNNADGFGGDATGYGPETTANDDGW